MGLPFVLQVGVGGLNGAHLLAQAVDFGVRLEQGAQNLLKGWVHGSPPLRYAGAVPWDLSPQPLHLDLFWNGVWPVLLVGVVLLLNRWVRG